MKTIISLLLIMAAIATPPDCGPSHCQLQPTDVYLVCPLTTQGFCTSNSIGAWIYQCREFHFVAKQGDDLVNAGLDCWGGEIFDERMLVVGYCRNPITGGRYQLFYRRTETCNKRTGGAIFCRPLCQQSQKCIASIMGTTGEVDNSGPPMTMHYDTYGIRFSFPRDYLDTIPDNQFPIEVAMLSHRRQAMESGCDWQSASILRTFYGRVYLWFSITRSNGEYHTTIHSAYVSDIAPFSYDCATPTPTATTPTNGTPVPTVAASATPTKTPGAGNGPNDPCSN